MHCPLDVPIVISTGNVTDLTDARISLEAKDAPPPFEVFLNIVLFYFTNCFYILLNLLI